MQAVTAREVFSLYVKDSQVVYKGPCWFYCLSVNAASGGVARADVYDGTDVNGDLLFGIQAPADGHRHFKLCFPVYFAYGVYFKAAANVEDAFVQLLPAC